ncbi:hypothetical protein [Paenibacillus oleatilyticus]|uniref:Uncharacterized protein n=1 Tax=Paenibacillus oleatilyticus TaxID=2594886 RepID=A0ABV4UZ57_9BACL
MLTAKRLPVVPNPGFETECYHNLRLSIVMTEPRLMPWCLSHFVNLIVQSKRAGQFPLIRFEEHLELYGGLLVEEPLAVKPGGYVSAIREAIDEGSYVLVYLDWKRIPQSHFFAVREMVHDALVYGYDDESGTLDILAFETNGRAYGSVCLPYETCEAELAHVAERHADTHIWFAYYGFPLTAVRLHRSPSLPSGFDYRSLYFALERGRVRAPGLSQDAFASGYFVYDYMAGLFHQMAGGDVSLDPREFGFWNINVHKMMQRHKWMLKRIDALERAAGSPLLGKSKRLYENAKQRLMSIRADSLKAQKTGDARLLASIGDHFQAMYEQEKRAVPLLMEYLVRLKFERKGEGGL